MNPSPIVQQRCSTGTPSMPFLRRKLGLSIWRHCETQSAASRSIARAPAQQLILLRCTNINPIGPQGLRWHDRMFFHTLAAAAPAMVTKRSTLSNSATTLLPPARYEAALAPRAADRCDLQRQRSFGHREGPFGHQERWARDDEIFHIKTSAVRHK